MNTLKIGDKGTEVLLLQRLLRGLGYTTASDGIFDAVVKDKVIEFQKEHELDADGIVGYCSWENLLFAGRLTNLHQLTDADFTDVASLLDVEPAVLKAVQQVETGGKGGFFAPGKPAILFEGHIFWSQLKKRDLNPESYVAGNENILYPKWEKKHYKGGIKEYERLEQARIIHPEAADASASWGMFQIMGFNYAACGEKSVTSFVEAMSKSELKQLLLSAAFMKKEGMLPYLRNKNWAGFAKRYNGPQYAQNHYDDKLAEAYRIHSDLKA